MSNLREEKQDLIKTLKAYVEWTRKEYNAPILFLDLDLITELDNFSQHFDELARERKAKPITKTAAVNEIVKDLMHIPCLQAQQGNAWEIAEHLYGLGYSKPISER